MPITFQCMVCGKSVTTCPSQMRNKKYCSLLCRDTVRNTQVTLTCQNPNCGKEFKVYRNRSTVAKWCSVKCASACKVRSCDHGKIKTGTYNTWCSMKSRCSNPNADNYRFYGGRGIKVCERWMASFRDFHEDMGDRPKGYTLDRIDPNGDYTPSNCHWIPSSEQGNNMRSTRHLTYAGSTKSVRDWAATTGIDYKNIHNRLKLGWSVEKTLTTPIRKRFK